METAYIYGLMWEAWRGGGVQCAICPPASATSWLPLCGFQSTPRARPAAADSAMTASMSFLSTGCGLVRETPMSVTMVHRMEAPWLGLDFGLGLG